MDVVSNQLVTANLTETQAKELSDRINVLVNMAITAVATLKADLIQAEGALRATASVPSSPTSEGSTDSLTTFHFGSEIAKQLATLMATAEKDQSPNKKLQ